jgi:TorA maturation chaperone TorD
LNPMKETAPMPSDQRSAIYSLLAQVYMTELSKDLLETIMRSGFLTMLSDKRTDQLDLYFKGDTNELLEDLACEYARLFIGPGKHISPHESVHHKLNGGDWGKLWGASTATVRNFIKSAGMTYLDDFSGMPDHIAVEFEFMKQLTSQEIEAGQEEDKEQIAYFLSMEKKFLEEHIGCWVPDFCEKILAETSNLFYQRIAVFTKEFIEFELQAMDQTQVKVIQGTKVCRV